MKVTVISTGRNEEKSVKSFLDALLVQSRKPDEIVICDANSTDKTVEIIEGYIKKFDFIKLISKPGNISVGRNAAIEAATYENIAVTDMGTIADADWLKNLLKPFESDMAVTAVAGFFKIRPESYFEEMSATLMLSDHNNINPETWLPSSRSIAFTKKAWQDAGRYPENLSFAGEDTLFDLNLKKSGHPFAMALDAVVYWRPRSSLKSFLKQYFLYAKGDGEALNFPNGYMKKTIIYASLIASMLILYWNWWLIAIWLVLYIIYILKWTGRVMRKMPQIKTFFLAPALFILFDITSTLGFYKGLWKRYV